jgi:hypothetical protein
MDDQKRREDGTAQRRKVLGDAWVDKSAASANSFNREFIDLITRHRGPISGPGRIATSAPAGCW